MDVLYVMSRVVADAAQSKDPDPVVLDIMDSRKAYDDCSRTAMEHALKVVGVPHKMRNLLNKLDSLTTYKCRSAIGLSQPYWTNRGTRQGRPAAPVKFNTLHLPDQVWTCAEGKAKK